MFSLPNLSHITLVWVVQVGEVAPAFGGAVPVGSAASTSSSVDSRDGEEDGGKAKGKGKAKAKGNKRYSTPPPEEGGAGEQKRYYPEREENGHKDAGDHLGKQWNEEVGRNTKQNKKMALEQV